MDRARVLLKRKYRLVHVPREEKARSWQTEVQSRIAAGAEQEAAGARAAGTVFPYEFRGSSDPGITVAAVLECFPD